MGELGKIDYPKIYKQNKKHSVSATLNLFQNQEQIKRKMVMPLPILGHTVAAQKVMAIA